MTSAETNNAMFRCESCLSQYTNASKKRNRWRAKAPIPTATSVSLCVDCNDSSSPATIAPWWQVTASPEKLAEHVQNLFMTNDAEGVTECLVSVAKHAAVEPEIFKAVNPIDLQNGKIVSFCPSLLEAESICSCSMVTIKQKRSENVLYCDVCSCRLRKRDERHPYSSTTTFEESALEQPHLQAPSAYVNNTFLSRSELIGKCDGKSAVIRKMRCQYARLCASATRNQARVAVLNSESSCSLNGHTASSVQGICADVAGEPANSRTIIESVLRTKFQVRSVQYVMARIVIYFYEFILYFYFYQH